MKSFKPILIFTLMLVLFGALLPLGFAPPSIVRADAGTDWIGQFYNSADLSGPVIGTGLYPTGLNFNWGNAGPTDGLGVAIPGVSADNFSGRFTTTASIAAGLYEFVITADDGARLFIDGVNVLDFFGSTSLNTQSAILQIGGGVYTLIVEYRDVSGPAVLQVNWFPSSGTPFPTASPPPVAVGSVERVRGLAVRTGPYLGASMVAVARPGNSYPILARNTSEGLFTWYLIRVREDLVGWSSGRYLAVTGDPNQVPLQNTIFDDAPPPDIGIRGVTRSVMNLRVRPSVRTARLDQIPWGDEVVIHARTVQGGLDFWYLVSWNGKVGWILASYVGVRGLIDAVPIR